MKQTGILLIHGLMGSPREYIPLETTLLAEGYQTRVVTLPGHGFSPLTPFGKVQAQDLLDHCMAEYLTFSEHLDEVVIIGHSLGGLCTLLTAAQRPEKLVGIVGLSTPYEHAYWVNRTTDLLSVPLNVLIPGVFYAPESRTGFERPQYSPIVFPRLLQESRTMFEKLREEIHEVSVPVCLAHSIYDLSIPYAEMDKLASSLIGSSRITTHTLENSGHQIFPFSQDRDPTIHLILHFLHQECHIKPRRFRLLSNTASPLNTAESVA